MRPPARKLSTTAVLHRYQQIAATALFAAALLATVGCGSSPSTSSSALDPAPPPTTTTTTTAAPTSVPTSTPLPTPLPTPAPPPTTSSGGVMITSPASGATIQSPAQFSFAIANAPPTYDHMELQADGTGIIYTGQQSITNAFVLMPAGAHAMSLVAYDAKGDILGESAMSVTVSGPATPPVMPNIQTILGWTWCTAALPNGQPCASGLGNATSTRLKV